MTINFSNISFDLQVVIAKKMDFWTNLQFQLSSKEGRSVGDSSSQLTVLDVYKVQCDQDIIRLLFEDPVNKKKFNKRWSSIRGYSNLPKFCVHYLETFPNISPEDFDAFLEEAKFVKKKASLCWSHQEIAEMELFIKVVEKINVTSFTPGNSQNIESNYTLACLPEFIQMESINFPVDPVPDAIFLAVKAHTISCFKLISYPEISFTVNRFLKQWQSKQREIRSILLIITQCGQTERVNFFSDLPVSMLCSNKNTIWNVTHLREIYVLDRGDKRLQLVISYHNLFLTEIEDFTLFKKEIKYKLSKEGMERSNKQGIVPTRKPNRLVRTFDRFRYNCTVS